MFTHLRRLLRSTRRLPQKHEIDVVEALLPTSDARSPTLLRQFREAPYVVADQPDRARYDITVPFVKGNIPFVEIPYECSSPVVVANDSRSGEVVAFRLTVRAGGYCGPLSYWFPSGRRMSRDWSVELREVRDQLREENWLAKVLDDGQTRSILIRLCEWLNCANVPTEELRRDIVVRDPVSEGSVAAWERREGVQVPEELLAFYLITDGLRYKALDIGRLEDVYVVSEADSDLKGIMLQPDPSGYGGVVYSMSSGCKGVYELCDEESNSRRLLSGRVAEYIRQALKPTERPS